MLLFSPSPLISGAQRNEQLQVMRAMRFPTLVNSGAGQEGRYVVSKRIPLRRLLFLYNFSVNDRAFVVLAAFRSAARFGLRSGLAASGALARAGLL